MTIHQAILHGAELLQRNEIDQPKWNSERLLMLALARSRTQLYSDLNHELNPIEFSQFSELLNKRAAHFPLAYLEGTQEFFGREFFVNDAVLIPRPETEELVRAVLQLPLRKPRILDLGSGSGAIPATLVREIPGSDAVALEISALAIPVLKRNCEGKLAIVRGDFASLGFLAQTFDLITANLPYVEAEDFANLPLETKWEPRLALFTQSLEETYERAIREGVRVLKPGGYMVMEFGYGQAERLKKLVERQRDIELLEIRNDQQGIPRVLILQRL